MIKVVGFLHRNPNMTQEEFIHFWKTVHVPMVKSKLPGLIKYIGNFPVAGASAPHGNSPPYDGLIELGFDSVESMTAAMSGPAFMMEDRILSSATLMDLDKTQSMVFEEIVVPL